MKENHIASNATATKHKKKKVKTRQRKPLKQIYKMIPHQENFKRDTSETTTPTKNANNVTQQHKQAQNSTIMEYTNATITTMQRRNTKTRQSPEEANAHLITPREMTTPMARLYTNPTPC